MTVVVAILLALGVPFAQLRTIETRIECCCPSPEHCKCPDHKPDAQGQPMMRACHKTQHDVVSPQLPAFVPIVVELATAAPQLDMPIVHVLADPLPAPPPRRPDAPS